ncbi:MAG: methyltransferase domain-containing protein [Phycisphaerales bacterium]|nr:methyltransferase domain-containing protein [Phycisphaerales bacterium]
MHTHASASQPRAYSGDANHVAHADTRESKAAQKSADNSRGRGPGRASFITEFIRKPSQVGAVAPSGKALARRMLKDVDFNTASVIVEFGPGTGAFTREILSRLQPRTRFVAIELSELFADRLHAKFPTLNLHRGSVTEVASAVKALGVEHPTESVDAIISGLPWASFSESLQRSILDATLPVLKPAGVLITFGYAVSTIMPASKRFTRKLLPEYFASVTRSRSVWMNFPPAFVLTCRKAGPQHTPHHGQTLGQTHARSRHHHA